MKAHIFFLLLVLSGGLMAQNPKTISYQGVARNAAGQPIPNQAIKLRLSLLDTITSTSALYSETHALTTSGQGLFSLQMGGGTVESGVWTEVNWSAGPRYLKTEIDPTGGTNYTLTTFSPFNAVPYALHAASGNQGPPGPQGPKGDTGVAGPAGSFPPGNAVGDMQYWDGTQWVMIPIGEPGRHLKNCEGTITWNPCKPVIATVGPTSVSATGIATGGNISDDGDAPVTVRGMCWSTSPNPTTAGSKTMDGSGTGAFARTISGLSLGTTYYIRAYATNSIGTSYGNELTVTTLTSTVPTVSTSATTAIDGNSANSGGNVTNNGGATVTSRGVVWDTIPGPTIGLSTKTVNGSGNGSFISTITGLKINTVYYVRAYATNSAGTGYGSQLTFTSALFTVGNGVTDIDGNAYNSIIIGAQEWMKENLKVSKYRNGDAIPTGLDDASWATTTEGAFSIYNNSAANNTTYGKLYNFYTVADPRGLCPAGWHEPTDSDWGVLITYLDSTAVMTNPVPSSIAGGMVKAVSNLWASPNTGATNRSGFTGLPAGRRNEQGDYDHLSTFFHTWSASEFNPANAWYYGAEYNVNYLGRANVSKNMGLPVRCLKD